MTNRDKINSLSNEKLYEFITSSLLDILKYESTSFHDNFLKWLDEEYNPENYKYSSFYDWWKEG